MLDKAPACNFILSRKENLANHQSIRFRLEYYSFLKNRVSGHLDNDKWGPHIPACQGADFRDYLHTYCLVENPILSSYLDQLATLCMSCVSCQIEIKTVISTSTSKKGSLFS